MEKTSAYANLDKIYILERDNENLKLVCSQQKIAIQALQKESSLKSQKILELQKLRAHVTLENEHVLRPKMQLSSVVSGNNYSTAPPSSRSANQDSAKGSESAKLAEKSILALQTERDFWRRHFLQTDSKLKDVIRSYEKKSAETIPSLQEIDQNTGFAENGKYVQNLLEENLGLKAKLFNNKPGEEKENVPLPPNITDRVELAGSSVPAAPRQIRSNPVNTQTTVRPRNPGTSNRQCTQGLGPGLSSNKGPRFPSTRGARITLNKINPSNNPSGSSSVCPQPCVPQPSSQSNEIRRELHGLTEENTCLLNQVRILKAELEKRASDISCCCKGRSPCRDGPKCSGGPPPPTKGSCSVAPPTIRGRSPTRGRGVVRGGVVRGGRGGPSATRGGGVRTPGSRSRTPPAGRSKTPPASRPGVLEGPGELSSSSCANCARFTCRNEKGVRFEDSLLEDEVHLCQHIQCLQRQVVHLKKETESTEEARKAQRSALSKLAEAQREIKQLSSKCDELLDLKRDHLDRISFLNKQVEVLLCKDPQQDKVKHLVQEIEKQRDRYKDQVQTLIQQLKSDLIQPRFLSTNEPVYNNNSKPVQQQTSTGSFEQLQRVENAQSNVHLASQERTTIQSKSTVEGTRGGQGLGSAQADKDVFLDKRELAMIRNELSRKQDELTLSKLEVTNLRAELMDCLAQLQRGGEKGTQTSPRNQLAEKEMIKAEKAKLEVESLQLAADQNRLKVERFRIEAERDILLKERSSLEIQRERYHQEMRSSRDKQDGRVNVQEISKSKSSPNLPPTASGGREVRSVGGGPRSEGGVVGGPGSVHDLCERELTGVHRTVAGLQSKIVHLEKLLENTENALKINQNQNAENSKRCYEQSSQILQLKNAVSQANITGDQLRAKLDKKEDLVRRLLDEKNSALDKERSTRDKMAELEKDLSSRRRKIEETENEIERLKRIEKDEVDYREREVRSVEEREKRLKEKEKRVEEKEKEFRRMKDEWSRSDETSKKISSENSSLKEEYSRLDVEYKEKVRENQDKAEEINILKIELQKYITEVRRIEAVLEDKEKDRRRILIQFEELSRENHETETINRTLEMQTDNLVLEIKAKQSDLEAAKARCEGLDKYVEEVLRQNEQFRTQIITLNAKVDMLTADLQDNRIARDSVLTDLDGVNELAVKLNSDKVDLLHRIGTQNSEVETLQGELVKLREELLAAMANLEDERHRGRTLQNLVISTQSAETRETVIKEVEEELTQNYNYERTQHSDNK